MRGNGSSWETRTRIPRHITPRNTIIMIKVSRRRRIEQSTRTAMRSSSRKTTKIGRRIKQRI